MINEIDTQDITFFASDDSARLLPVEIRKLEARLTSLRYTQEVIGVYQRTLNQTSRRPIVERAWRLGQRVNEGANPAFVSEVEGLSFVQLCFLAKGYDASRIGQRVRADCLQVFMLAHKATVDEAAQKFVATGAKRAGGKFFEIFQHAQQKHNKSIVAVGATSDLCRAASLAKATSEMLPLATIPHMEKAAALTLFHGDFIATMARDKSWGSQEAAVCCNIRAHVYKNAMEWRIDVPRGIDPRDIKVFGEQHRWGLVEYDTVDVVVVKSEKLAENDMSRPIDNHG